MSMTNFPSSMLIKCLAAIPLNLFADIKTLRCESKLFLISSLETTLIGQSGDSGGD